MENSKSSKEWIIRFLSFLAGMGSSFVSLASLLPEFHSIIFAPSVLVLAIAALVGILGLLLLFVWRASEAENRLRLVKIEAGIKETQLRSEFREKLLRAT